MKRTLVPSLLLSLGIAGAHAGLLAHFKLDEGAIDPFTNMIYSAVSTNTGTFAPAAPPSWDTANLAPIPVSEGGTTAYLVHPDTSIAYTVTDLYAPTGSTARTLSAWVKFPIAFRTNGAAAQGSILSYGTTTPNLTRFTLALDATGSTPRGKLRFEIAGANMVGNMVVADDNWHHVAMACPNGARMSNVVLYVDGNRQTIVASGSLGALLNTSAGTSTLQPLHIGTSIHNMTLPCRGLIDDIRVYDHQLSDSEILQLVFGAGAAPGIGQHPANATALLGATNTTVSFSVGLAAGSPPISYQWKRNGTDVPGGTDSILTLSPVTAADIGNYTVGVTNPWGGELSLPASLSWSVPALHPREQSVLADSNAAFTITLPADSTGYTYQWMKGGAAIAGATESSYTIAPVVPADAADYSVRVSLGGETATSPLAPLRVLSVPSSAFAQLVLADGAAAYWRLGENNGAATAADGTGFHPGEYRDFFGTELEMPGAVLADSDTAAQFYGGNYVEVPTAAALQPEPTYTLEAWVSPSDASGRHSVICSRSQYLSRGYELASSGSVWQFRTGNQDTTVSEVWNDLNGGMVAVGQWQHVVATHDGTTKQLYVDGKLVASQTMVAKATEGYPVRIGAGRTHTSPPGDYFSGAIDEVAVYWKALSADQISRHYSVGKYANTTAPFILQEPAGGSRYEHGRFAFTVSAEGSYPLNYQWRHAGTNLAGATGASLLLTGLQQADAGDYSVVITNGLGKTNSATATLTVVPITETGYRRVVMHDAPAAYFPLDDTNFAATASELYNFGAYDGTYQNSPMLEQAGATPNTGYSVEFDGASQAVLFGNPAGLDFSGQISLEAWVKPVTNYLGGGYGNIVAHGYGGSPNMEVLLRIYNGQYQAGSYDGANHVVSYAVPAADLGNWVHLVGTYDGEAWNLYRNGALVARANSAVGAVSVGADWAIAARGTGTERYFQGNLDEVAIYPAALTPAQVARHYFAATGQTGSLSLARSGSNIVLTWNAGMLQEADDVTGLWTDLPAAVSPFSTPASAVKKFYRLRW